MALFSNGNKTCKLIMCIESESLARSSCLKCIEERMMAAGLCNQCPLCSGRPICFATSCHLNMLQPDNYVTIVLWSKAHTPYAQGLPVISRPASASLTLKPHTPYPITSQKSQLGKEAHTLTWHRCPFQSPLLFFCFTRKQRQTHTKKFPTFRVHN